MVWRFTCLIYKFMIIKRKLYSLAGTRILAGFNKKVLRKAPMAAKRSAIKTQNKVLSGVARGLNKVEGVNGGKSSSH